MTVLVIDKRDPAGDQVYFHDPAPDTRLDGYRGPMVIYDVKSDGSQVRIDIEKVAVEFDHDNMPINLDHKATLRGPIHAGDDTFYRVLRMPNPNEEA